MSDSHQFSAPQVRRIGPYEILETIGRGGMGQVFLAYDPVCERQVALKCIRSDLKTTGPLLERFTTEAKITAQLTHPAIIPIYAISQDKEQIFYTMPYVEGPTLREIIRQSREQHKAQKAVSSEGSIPHLMRIFVSLCQAIAYAHSEGVLHRDIKPENIIVGKYGQIVILDWGIAERHSFPPSPRKKPETAPNRIVGTLAYLAPERARGEGSSQQTDIYALGIMLYHLLTLQLPYRRTSLASYQKTMHLEKWIEPAEVAPYRDVPQNLANICKKAMAPDPTERYQTVDSLIADLLGYVEGTSEWFLIENLDINRSTDWEFQENIYIPKNMAISRTAEGSEWVNIMVSSASFAGNTRLEMSVLLEERCQGLGFLLSVPEQGERLHPYEGYCIWLGTKAEGGCKFYRSTAEVLSEPELFLEPGKRHRIVIEKVDYKLTCRVDNGDICTYISYLPLTGTHLGLLAKDRKFVSSELSVLTASPNVTINCLAVPEAFLANRDYQKALLEFRRIAYSFPGRAEGREAQFRAGITLMARAMKAGWLEARDRDLDLAGEEFAKLHQTAGAPLEYLGKALICLAKGELEEEAKYLEYALHKYKGHPLLRNVQEQVLFRMHDGSRPSRLATYRLALIGLRHLLENSLTRVAKQLFTSIAKNCEVPSFFLAERLYEGSSLAARLQLSLLLAYWLRREHIISEVAAELLSDTNLSISLIEENVFDACFALLELGSREELSATLTLLANDTALSPTLKARQMTLFELSQEADLGIAYLRYAAQLPKDFGPHEQRFLEFLCRRALRENRLLLVHKFTDLILVSSYLTDSDEIFSAQLAIDSLKIWAYLLENNVQEAGEMLGEYSVELITQEGSLLSFLYGCYLRLSEGDELSEIYFASCLDEPYPKTHQLALYYLASRKESDRGWQASLFAPEKGALWEQLALLAHCEGDTEKAKDYREKALSWRGTLS